MKCFEWLNEQIGDFDVFLVANKIDTETIVQHFATKSAKGCKSNIADEWYYFVNTKNKTITPMPMLSLAFGCQYNEEIPYGKEMPQFSFKIEEYSLRIHNFCLTP